MFNYLIVFYVHCQYRIGLEQKPSPFGMFQKDFFTKTWGDSFVEVSDIPGPRYLPHITLENFQAYLKKTAKVSSTVNCYC